MGGVLGGDGIPRTKGCGAELGPSERGCRGVGQVGPDRCKGPAQDGLHTMHQTKTPMTAASCARMSDPMAPPTAASRAAPTPAPAMCPRNVTALRVTWSPSAATKARPTTGGDGPAATPYRSRRRRPRRFGRQHPVAVGGGQISEGGAGVAELAAREDDAEHRRQDHGYAADGGDRSKAGAGRDRRHPPAGPGGFERRETRWRRRQRAIRR